MASTTWQKLEVSNPLEIDEHLSRAIHLADASKIDLYIMITTEFTGENGQRWCPDCRKADPIIYAALDKKKDAILLEAPVARNDYKGNPEYIYRTHPLIAVTAVPTLIHHKTTDATLALTVNKRLVEAECYDQAKVNEFFGLE